MSIQGSAYLNSLVGAQLLARRASIAPYATTGSSGSSRLPPSRNQPVLRGRRPVGPADATCGGKQCYVAAMSRELRTGKMGGAAHVSCSRVCLSIVLAWIIHETGRHEAQRG